MVSALASAGRGEWYVGVVVDLFTCIVLCCCVFSVDCCYGFMCLCVYVVIIVLLYVVCKCMSCCTALVVRYDVM